MAYSAPAAPPRDPWNRPVRRVDTSRHAPMAGLGEICPECYIASGGDCEICPDGADDFPECAGCVNGRRENLKSTLSDSLVIPVIAGVVTTLLVAYLSGKILHQKS